jgi:hypothetical protein
VKTNYNRKSSASASAAFFFEIYSKNEKNSLSPEAASPRQLLDF